MLVYYVDHGSAEIVEVEVHFSVFEVNNLFDCILLHHTSEYINICLNGTPYD